jgi:hypothetical protein
LVVVLVVDKMIMLLVVVLVVEVEVGLMVPPNK